jgi:hypothetical protein
MLNKFTNNLDDTPLHSSGYAEAANTGSFGSVTPQTFNQRMHVENNRTAVRGYRHSMIGHGHHRSSHYQRVDIVNASSRPSSEPQSVHGDRSGSAPVRPAGRLIADVARPAQRQNFVEPSTRGYNPYK